MFLNSRMFAPKKVKQLAPYLLHLVMVVAVAAYVVCGALAVRVIEARALRNAAAAQQSQNVQRIQRNSDEKWQKSEVDDEKRRPLSWLRSRRCVISALHRIIEQTQCDKSSVDLLILRHIDDCYLDDIDFAVATEKRRRSATVSGSAKSAAGVENNSEMWSFTDSILFCFTVITTIGYGNVAPQTTNGRLFVIMYGLLGVPFTMLAIANLGKFLAELLKMWTRPFIQLVRKVYRRLKVCCIKFKRRRRRPHYHNVKTTLTKDFDKSTGSPDGDGDTDEEFDGDTLDDDDDKEKLNEAAEEEQPMETAGEAIMLFLTFFVYIFLGSMIIASYEPEMDFFMAIYFNFVTLTTIGLGDLVPKSETYLIFTLLYCTIGLALTTIAIEIAADYLKRLHYFGRKMDHVGNVQIWFGGQKLTMRQLVRNLGDQFNVPVEQLKNLNLENFVDNAMKVEAGEISTLRMPEKRYANDYLRCIDSASVVYVDADELLFPVQPNPYAQYPLNKINSRSVSPLLLISEHAPCGPTPPPIPEETECETLSTKSLSLNSVNAIQIRDQPEMRLGRIPYVEEPVNHHHGISPSNSVEGSPTPSTRNQRHGRSEVRTRRQDYSEEARKRYEEYQKQWKKFRATQTGGGGDGDAV